MDGIAAYDLGKILYEERLREAASRERMYLSAGFRKLPRLVQVLIAALS
jgi:hypothetical protein